ncbi:MAG: PAS domain S-box protein, partial [Maribacter sp.]|nr:PAS domain S-box protein [Maribacter sp.]
IWVNTIGRPKFKEGKCIRIIGTIQHIQDEIVQNVETSNSIKIDYPLFEKVPIGLAIIELETGNFLNLNQQMLKLTGFEKEYFLNKNYKQFVNAHFSSKSENLTQQLLEKGSFTPIKFTFSNNKKHLLNLKVTGTLVEDSTNIKSVLCTFENIT